MTVEAKENQALLNHKKLAEIIKASGLTQERFAEEIGISDSYLRSLKRADKNISINLAYNISQKSGCSIEKLLTTTQNKKNSLTIYKNRIAMVLEMLHAVKNNLQNVGGLMSILAIKCAKQGITIDTIEQISQELSETTARLAAYIQQTSNRTNLCRCSLNIIIQEIINSKQVQFQNNHIQLQSRLADNLPLLLLDRQLIRQVLINCLNNSRAAIQAKEQPINQILVSTRLTDSGKTVQLLIEDNGVGLTPEQQSNFFKPYYTAKTGGNGIGNSISQAIIKLHGGNISINGQPDSGCCVQIELPVQSTKLFNNDDLYSEIADMLL